MATIQFRTEYCALNSMKPSKVPHKYVHIYTRMEDVCQAKCRFCDYHNKKDTFKFDIKRYKQLISNILAQDIVLNKVAFTGGEPTLNLQMMNECIEYIKNKSPNTYISINTNGIHAIGISRLVDCISLSRHHYDDGKNEEIFGTKVLDTEQIKHLQFIHGNLHLSCNLIKGYIDSREKVFKFLEFVASTGIYSTGFVDLMEANEYAKKHLIRLQDIDLTSDRLIKNKTWRYKDFCSCSNYLYMPEKGNKIVGFYNRHYRDHLTPVESTIVFDGESPRENFCGKTIDGL
jgi:molybdenum cofactor biosynthesis enzyme MoaA